jgi:uncharacterized protein YfdQ (DUF2303 family)
VSDPLMSGQLISEPAAAAVIADLATRAADPNQLDPDGRLLGVVVPDGARLHLVDVTAELAKHQPAPERATGTHTASTVQSFIDITRRHERGDDLTVWVHPTSGAITAVLNDHGRGQNPQWGDHRVRLDLLKTEEWKRWAALDGKLIEQEPFAEHIQDGLTEIAEPAAADLLEIVQTMQGATSASWKAGVRIVDGSVQMQYVEEADARAGTDGQLSIPTEFTLVVAPFVGEPPATILARLRWRLRNGKLHIGYKLDNPERVLRETLEKIAERLEAEFIGAVYLGSPR